VRTTYAAAGITLKREGGRTLRNTFAQRELEAGASLADLEEYLGLHDRRSAERYAESARLRIQPEPVPIT
jgi:site-specific recombinase XerD